jgi:hypothetical protein
MAINWVCDVQWSNGAITTGGGETEEEARRQLEERVSQEPWNRIAPTTVTVTRSVECRFIGGSTPPPPDRPPDVPPPPVVIDVFHIDLLFYDATAGEAEFYKTDGTGNLSLLKKLTGFRKTWQSIVPGDFGGGRYTGLLFYDAIAGEGEFYNTDDKGNLSLLKKTTGFRKTWQSIVPGNFSGGNRYTDLLFYDATAGEAEFYKTDGRGNLSLLKKLTGFRKTWQSIVPGNFGGGTIRSDLLFYDATTGEGEFYKIDDTGNLSLLKKLTGFRKTWQSIVPGDFGDRT